METVTSLALQEFFKRLGEKVSAQTTFYLVGGSALCLLGSRRETLDVDYFVEDGPPKTDESIKELSAELQMDLEPVPLGEFIPLPPEAAARRRFVGRYGQVEVPRSPYGDLRRARCAARGMISHKGMVSHTGRLYGFVPRKG